jgi:hypothetical protein
MTVPVFNEGQHAFDGLLEAIHQVSIDEVVLTGSQTVLVGNLLGAIGVSGEESSTNAPGAGNVGNGTLGAVTINSSAVNGIYAILFESATRFDVLSPDGTTTSGTVGSAYVGELSFTFTAGGTAFAAGDTWTITVLRPFDEAGSQFELWSPTATDGSQFAVAIALQKFTTGLGLAPKIAALARQGAFRAIAVNYPTGTTLAQQAAAQQQLAAVGIILR